MTIQELIGKASEGLKKAYEVYSASHQALKDLKKELKNALKNNHEWQELEDQVKLLKQNRKDLSEQIKELQRKQDQMAVELDEYQVVQDFVISMDDKFAESKDKELNQLSKELTEKGVEAEIEYKNGKLFLIVAKHKV